MSGIQKVGQEMSNTCFKMSDSVNTCLLKHTYRQCFKYQQNSLNRQECLKMSKHVQTIVKSMEISFRACSVFVMV